MALTIRRAQQITRPRACCWRRQPAYIEEIIVGVCIVDVGLALTHVVHYDRSELNRLHVLASKTHVRDYAFPCHGLSILVNTGGTLKMKLPRS